MADPRGDRGDEDDRDGDAQRRAAASRAARALEAARRAAGRADAHPFSVRVVEGLRRRLPGDERFGDPLSTAGRAPAEVVAREVQAFEPGRPSAVHGLGLGALQVWQALAEASGRGRGDRPIALLLTDLVRFSSFALEAGDTATLSLLRDAGGALEGAVKTHRGTIVKRLGDGLMASFAHPQQAVEAALDGLDAIAALEVDGYDPQMRAGVHWGRPRRLGGDLFGVDVNVAARIGEAAGAQELLVSEAALALVDVDALDLGRSKRLKADGAPKDLRVRRVRRAAGP
ncbi:adenylate/guanylate cyclase domain-containing protein [Conexibacter sp. SYSU D00693]|uniref:adenylate/guanylate cyclase domain-containing protein n=1 Tax=Conexibacter sp. SYSU D00693 TaxID=2812560 RepID=UPI00196AA506|nr:adenylate/guanylate cyclase domain-containing protein [Conexibacter sp. SYSU D00693]